jgi:peptidoglycan/LPS O-acetylase OafA/YrhL
VPLGAVNTIELLLFNQNMPGPPNPHRESPLDGLRGLASLVVVLNHGIAAFDFALFTGASRDSRFSWDVSLSGAPFLIPLAGNFSVCIFFALSGYVLSKSFASTGLGMVGLLFKRYTRLVLPIFAICMLSCLLLWLGLFKNAQLSQYTRSAWLATQTRQAPSFREALQEGSYGALTHIMPYQNTYNGALWTMNIELFGSVMLIFVFGFTKNLLPLPRSRNAFRILLLLALGIVASCSYLGLFAVGALLSLTRIGERIGSRVSAILLCVGVFLGTVPFSVAPWGIVRPFSEWRLPYIGFVPFPESSVIFCHAAGAVMLLLAANSSLIFRRLLASPILQFLGRISFPLYLIHMPVLLTLICWDALSMLSRGVPYFLTAGFSVILLVAVSIAAATAFCFVCEEPAIALSKRIGIFTDRITQAVSAFIRGAGRKALT